MKSCKIFVSGQDINKDTRIKVVELPSDEEVCVYYELYVL